MRGLRPVLSAAISRELLTESAVAMPGNVLNLLNLARGHVIREAAESNGE